MSSACPKLVLDTRVCPCITNNAAHMLKQLHWDQSATVSPANPVPKVAVLFEYTTLHPEQTLFWGVKQPLDPGPSNGYTGRGTVPQKVLSTFGKFLRL